MDNDIKIWINTSLRTKSCSKNQVAIRTMGDQGGTKLKKMMTWKISGMGPHGQLREESERADGGGRTCRDAKKAENMVIREKNVCV